MKPLSGEPLIACGNAVEALGKRQITATDRARIVNVAEAAQLLLQHLRQEYGDVLTANGTDTTAMRGAPGPQRTDRSPASAPQSVDGLPYLGDNLIRMRISPLDGREGVINLFFHDQFVEQIVLDPVKWIFLSALVEASTEMADVHSTHTFVSIKKIVKMVRGQVDSGFSREYQTMDELRRMLVQPLLDKGFLREQKDRLPHHKRIIEQRSKLGYRLSLPPENLQIEIPRRRDMTNNVWEMARATIEREPRQRAS